MASPDSRNQTTTVSLPHFIHRHAHTHSCACAYMHICVILTDRLVIFPKLKGNKWDIVEEGVSEEEEAVL